MTRSLVELFQLTSAFFYYTIRITIEISKYKTWSTIIMYMGWISDTDLFLLPLELKDLFLYIPKAESS